MATLQCKSTPVFDNLILTPYKEKKKEQNYNSDKLNIDGRFSNEMTKTM